MNLAVSRSTKTLGFWSATLATVFSLVYVVAQLAEWSGLLGSAGGPESASTSAGLFILLTPSLLLAPAFLVLMVSLHRFAPPDRRAWSQSAVAFATIYAGLVGLVYYVQLTLVAPRIVQGRVDDISLLLFTPFDSFLYAVDILGYSCMSLATLFASRVVSGRGIERIARIALTANGLLLPFLALQMYVHALIWVAALWAITFPASTVALAILFRRLPVGPPDSGAW